MEKLSYFAQLSELFVEWMDCLDDADKPLFCKDGLMLKAYKLEKSIDTLWDESSRRVMFVLKDKNTPDDDDTRLWLVDGKKGKVNRELNSSEVTKTGFLPNIAKMLYGLVVDTIGFDQLDMKKVVEVWNTVPFAFVEAKKLAGYSTVDKPQISLLPMKIHSCIKHQSKKCRLEGAADYFCRWFSFILTYGLPKTIHFHAVWS